MKTKLSGGMLALPEPGKVDVLTSAQVAELGQREHVRVVGEQIVRGTAALGEKYLELCRYIRENKLAPVLVSTELKAIGMHKVRVSEINRVAQCGDALWSEFEARTIGFKKVLEVSRGSVMKLVAEVSGQPSEAVEDGFKELGIAGDEPGIQDATLVKTEKEKIASRKVAMERCAKSMLLNAAWLADKKENRRGIEGQWTLGDGWTLVLAKDKPATVKADKKSKGVSANDGGKV